MTEPEGDPDTNAVGMDPGNTDPEDLTAPLDPDDDVFTLVNADTGDPLQDAPPAG